MVHRSNMTPAGQPGTKPAGAGWLSVSLSAPIVIASHNGLRATEKAAAMLRAGADTLDAVIAGVNILEEDPSDHTIGYGGLPNREGVVELDACVMHGPTCGAGAVSGLRNIKTASKVAQLVMQRTDHVMLAGEGALWFARALGLKEDDLLTDESRRQWLQWKADHPGDGDWMRPVPPEVPDEDGPAPDFKRDFTYGTIHCCALDAAGNLSGVTTTSGLSYRFPGRVADSSIIGAGLYVDNGVGAAGATGRGEAALKICGAHTIVECMRVGMSPVDACLEALRRVVATTVEPQLKRKDGRPNFNLNFYALCKDGGCGAASMWSGRQFALYADGQNRLEDCAYLFERT
ncbi:MAG TPA: N(4)-(beta-N-acetylglucosaminyl)-L-asparaginase [Phycisphaerae bacterium]|nr:N(4)-(beta-N-acetylglucosaminyl)-L-asparaginase [Phycisphaerae bacterium]